MIERKIVTGLITNTDYLKALQNNWKSDYLQSDTAKLLAKWCWEYFTEFKKAPERDIELIYIQKLNKGIDKDLAEEIEEDILPSLSQEYELTPFSTEKLLADTYNYFTERQIKIHRDEIDVLMHKGEIDKAEELINNFKVETFVREEGLDLTSDNLLAKINEVFEEAGKPLITFPGALGEFWNEQMVKGGFVAFLAPEKRGKSFLLLEFLMRAIRQKVPVAFFQAGDMTENQQLMRLFIYLARKSNRAKYTGKQVLPVPDCVRNQNDTCNKKIREVNFGFSLMPDDELRTKLTKKDLEIARKKYPDYRNCYNCVEWHQKNSQLGSVWHQKIDVGDPLDAREVTKIVTKFLRENHKTARLSTHPNGTLTMSKMEAILNMWAKDGFIPKLIIGDYIDIYAPESTRMDFRHQENEKWKYARRISQEKDSLFLTVTQADALSYEKDLLTLKNYSEDKRKYAHVTAMFGMNQDPNGREKDLGVLRINQLTAREDAFQITNTIKVLQKLEIGRPFLGSYY